MREILGIAISRICGNKQKDLGKSSILTGEGTIDATLIRVLDTPAGSKSPNLIRQRSSSMLTNNLL